MTDQHYNNIIKIKHVWLCQSKSESVNTVLTVSLSSRDRLVGLVVKVTAFGFFSGSSHTSDLKIGTPVATLPGAWHDRVSAGTGWPGVSILYTCLSRPIPKIQ